MARHFKVLDILSDADRAEYEALLRQPSTTVDAALEWLAARGYSISRGAVHNHKRSFAEVLNGVKRSAEMAASFAQVAKDSGVEGLSEASLARFQQLMMEKLMELDPQDGLDSSELLNLSIALKTAVGTKQQIEKLKADFEAKNRAAVEEAAKKAQAGASGADVVATIKKALGIAA
ncbi:MAG: phage protein Gp27 family protein [Bacillota bacterium]